MNLVPVGDYGSDDEDEEDVDTPKACSSGDGSADEEDDDVKMMQALERGTAEDINEWRMSSGMDLMTDIPYTEGVVEVIQTTPRDASANTTAVEEAVVEATVKMTTSSTATTTALATATAATTEHRKASIVMTNQPEAEYHTVFGNMYRRPPKPLTSSAKQYVL